MGSGKLIAWLLLAVAVVAAAVGGAYFVQRSFDRRAVESDFRLARGLMTKGEPERASKVIQERIRKGQGSESWQTEALGLLLESQIEHDGEGARQTALQMIDPEGAISGEPWLRAHLFLGQAALDDDDAIGAEPHFKAVVDGTGASGWGEDLATLGLARIRMATVGVSPDLRDELKALLDRFPYSEHREEIQYVLGQCNLFILLSPIPDEGDEIYSIQAGDTISAVAKRNKIPQDLLLRVNGIQDPRRLSIGRRIKIPKVAFSIEIDKGKNTLTLLNNGRFFKLYPVRTGKIDYLTPEGDYKILTKKIDPKWSDPRTHKVYPPNHPENELGTRWMGFQGSSLGIHGTIHPESIGSYASNGCVGMLKDDVEELFDLIGVGTPIKIFGHIATRPTSS